VRSLITMVALGVALSGTALAADPSDRLKDVERERDESRNRAATLQNEADAASAEAARLRFESVAAAKKAQDLESSLSVMEADLARLDAEEKAKTNALNAERDRLAGLLAAMERIARHPPAALIAEPDGPADAVRGAILLRASVPAVEDRARSLRGELTELASLRAEISNRRAEAADAGRALEGELRRIASLAEEKTKFESRARAESRDEAKRAAQLAAKADDLRELLARIEAGRKAAPPPKPKPKPQVAHAAPGPAPAREAATAFLPARGEVVRGFGDDDEAGGKAKGLTIRTRQGAQVVSPADGEVVFAGPFRGYGQLLIIATGEDYHALLGGLDHIDAEVGQSVLAGEPVGTMRGSPKGAPDLYFELRRKGQPINPLPWLAAGNSKVNG
jgi:septal ring factor EnvC (AmiA/AmiB activator)